MPNYDILHKPSGQVAERFMSIAQLETFLAENPDYEVTFLKMQVGDPVALGVSQPPSDFTKYVLGPIEKRYFGKRKESRFRQPPKEV